jgi:hypothetical protein
VGARRPSTLARSTRTPAAPRDASGAARQRRGAPAARRPRPRQSSGLERHSLLREARARGEGLVHEPVEEHERLEHDLHGARALLCCAVAPLQAALLHGAWCTSDSISCRLHGTFQKTKRCALRMSRRAALRRAPWHAARQTALHRRILYVARARVGTARLGTGAGTRRYSRRDRHAAKRRAVATDGVRSRRRGRGASRCAA